MSKIVIAGAGIGGLTLALALHARGHACKIFEAAPRFETVGAGINIQPYAALELHRLGLASALAAASVTPLQGVYASTEGEIAIREPLGINAGFSCPQYSIHRAALHRILVDTVVRRLGRDALHLDHRCSGFEQNKYGVGARFEKKRDAIEADVLVGCDGIHSAVYRQLYPSAEHIRHSGVTMWRGVTRNVALLDGKTMLRCGRIGTGKLVAYPVRDPDEPDEIVLNWVAELREPARAERDWNRRVDVAALPEAFRGWRTDWLDIGTLVAQADFILEMPMVDRDPLPRWSHGRVTLLGDAAHPMYPVGSNGAGQAILDAASLAACMDTSTNPAAALGTYDDIRRPLVEQIVKSDREGGPDIVLDAIHATTRDASIDRAPQAREAHLMHLLAQYRGRTATQGTAQRRLPEMLDRVERH